MLQLTIVEAPEQETPEGTKHVVGPAGATIGRTHENTWVLSDEQSLLSRSHCRIVFESGVYLLEDASTNGSFLNDACDPVGRGNRAALQEGDTIRLGGYKLAVSIEPLGQRPPPFESQPPAFLVPEHRDEEPLPEDMEFGEAPFEDPEPADQPGPFAGVTPQPLSDSLFGSEAREGATPGAGLVPGGGLPREPGPRAGTGHLPVDAVMGTPPSEFPSPAPDLDVGATGDDMPAKPAAGTGGFSLQVPVADTPPDTPAVTSGATPEGIIPDDWWLETEPSAHGPELSPVAPSPEPARPATPAPPPAAMAPAAARQPRGTAGGHRAEAPQAEVEPGPVGFVASAAASGSAPVGLESQLREILGGVLGDHAAVLPVRDLLGAVGEMTAIVGVAAPRLMQALSSRTQFKDQLRLDQTMVRARDNNPLKFCDGAEEALQHMLLNDHPGLLQGRFAIEEAFTELATHQTALVGALQPALQETISQFAPDAVEAATESEGVGGFALSKGKGKLWDSYREIYARLSNPERGLLERRFMTALAQHYERKLKALQ